MIELGETEPALTEPAATDSRFRAAVWTLAALVLVGAFVNELVAGTQRYQLDFFVYRSSIQSWLSGQGLYSFSITVFDGQFPFTYPPFAALALAWVGLVPIHWGQAIWLTVQLGVALGLVWLVVRRVLPGRVPASWLGDAVILIAWMVAILNAPIAQSLMLGQVSLVMVALVVVDFVVVPAKFRGILTGITAAVKLLPLIFLPYFLVTRQWRAAANTAGGFAAATGLAFLVLPQESLLFWTQMLFQTGRVGEVSSLRNKSLLALLSQWGLNSTWLWLGLAAAFTAFGLWRAAQHHRRGEEFAAMVVVGLLSGLVAPLTWLHHLVWLTLAMIYLALVGGRRWMLAAAAIWVAFCFFSPVVASLASGPIWLMILQSATTLTLAAFVLTGLPRPTPVAGVGPGDG